MVNLITRLFSLEIVGKVTFFMEILIEDALQIRVLRFCILGSLAPAEFILLSQDCHYHALDFSSPRYYKKYIYILIISCHYLF